MEKQTKRKNKGITIVSLVVTIIILLILAGISLRIINGNENIIGTTISAKEQTEINSELGVIEKASTWAKGRNQYGKLKKETLEKALKQMADGEDVSVEENNNGSVFIVTFPKSKRAYKVTNDDDDVIFLGIGDQ